MGAANPGAVFAGDIDCRDSWAVLKGNSMAQLVDVRTAAEWTFVGLPDLSELGRSVLTVEWQKYPSMAVDPDFVAKTIKLLADAGAGRDTPVLFMCRSGGRSRAAAQAMAEAGFTKSYNVAGGFEGEPDSERHRGTRNGWKASGLPWRQN